MKIMIALLACFCTMSLALSEDRWIPSHRYFIDLCRHEFHVKNIPGHIRTAIEETCVYDGITKWREDCLYDIEISNIDRGVDTSSEFPYCPDYKYPDHKTSIKSSIRREIGEFIRDYIAGKVLDKIIKDAHENYKRARIGIEIIDHITRPTDNDVNDDKKPDKKPDAHIGNFNPNWGMA